MSTGAHFGGPPPGHAVAGDAGSNFLAGLADASPFTDDTKRINEGAQQLKSLAENGGFAISKEGLLRPRKECDTFLDGYPAIARDVYKLSEQAQMGSATTRTRSRTSTSRSAPVTSSRSSPTSN
jgi:hypothetical protein